MMASYGPPHSQIHTLLSQGACICSIVDWLQDVLAYQTIKSHAAKKYL